MPCRSKKRQSAVRLVRIRCLRSCIRLSSRVKSGCSATRATICFANFSRGETLPPRGFGALSPVSCQRCTHLTDELTLISKRSAASRREAPIFTASITRSRRSPEYDRAIAPPPLGESMRVESLTSSPLGIPPDSSRPETAIVPTFRSSCYVAARAFHELRKVMG